MANVSESLGAQFPMRTTSVSKDPVSPLSRGALSRPSALRRVSHASATLPPGAGRGRDPVRRTAARRAVIDHHAAWNTRLVASSDTAIRHGRGWVEREPLVQRSRPGQQRARERLRVRGDQPRMSAAWNQCGSPLTAFNSTSWTVIARSRAVSGYAIDPPRRGHRRERPGTHLYHSSRIPSDRNELHHTSRIEAAGRLRRLSHRPEIPRHAHRVIERHSVGTSEVLVIKVGPLPDRHL